MLNIISGSVKSRSDAEQFQKPRETGLEDPERSQDACGGDKASDRACQAEF